ncbi:transposase [Fimbriiglobus ruber]|uniref:Transposase IS204/IS1001/IS1096/IS1165 DDE domain-containing protein n=1 Tax=Fimbriiglobus ruber TaxID=1908690 RepID=A0A225DPN3_9BACT|nr:transposase [Fimbriiglobus ruber]OWK40558.1 hypothetical protein FRUB_05477 [Fimbriiglobus ruber]
MAAFRKTKTLGNWMGTIANYFVWRSSNGRPEWFNHGLRAIPWRAFGMVNFRHFFRLRALDRFGSPRKARSANLAENPFFFP